MPEQRMRHQHGRRDLPPAPPGYYALPALKASHWKWMVAIYIWLAGLAGATQILAALVLIIAPDMETAAAVTRPARYGALVAAAIGTALLIADLLTPRRFLNMLRIFRPTSPMSFGSYLLVAFTAFTALSVVLQLAADLALVAMPPRWVELLVQVPAAAFGLMMVVYTAPLLSATSTPLWAHSPGLLAGSFAGFSMAAGASALCLWGLSFGGSPWDEAFESIAFFSLGVAWLFLLAWAASLTRAKLLSPLVTGKVGWLFVGGVLAVGLMVPVAIHLWQLFTAEQLVWATATAAIGELIGSLMWRGALLLGGHGSARSAADALRFAGGSEAGSAAGRADFVPLGLPGQGTAPYGVVGGLSAGGALALVMVGVVLVMR